MTVRLLPVADVEACILQQQQNERTEQQRGREEGRDGIERVEEAHTDALLMAGLWILRSLQVEGGMQQQ